MTTIITAASNADALNVYNSCPVCLDDYQDKIRAVKVKKIQCQYCEAHACRGCLQRYILSSYDDPHCMSCKRGWSPEFMAASFGITFRSITLRQHRRKVLFEREKAMLPALQVYVEHKREREFTRNAMNELDAEIGNEFLSTPANTEKLAFRWRSAYNECMKLGKSVEAERNEITRLKGLMEDKDIKENPNFLASFAARLTAARSTRDTLKAARLKAADTFREINKEYVEKKDALRLLRNRFWTAHRLYEEGDTATPEVERRQFIMKCPAEDCRGFLSTAYKCGTCEARTCKDCLVCLGKGEAGSQTHTCVPDMVESAKAIRAETRPCPKCGTRIFKIDGCDQMWCVMEGCGTAFSWNSGHIVTGIVHNPHYYQWLRRQKGGAVPREAADIPCGGMPTTWQYVNAAARLEIPNEMKTIVLETFRNMQELVAQRLADYPARMPQLMNKEMDVLYLMNELTEDDWKAGLEKAEHTFNRKKEIGQILQTLVTAGSEMMNRLYEKMRDIDTDDAEKMDEFVGWLLDVGFPELDQLRTFGNDSLKGLAKRDRMAVPQLGEMWAWTRARALYRPMPVKGREVAELVD